MFAARYHNVTRILTPVTGSSCILEPLFLQMLSTYLYPPIFVKI